MSNPSTNEMREHIAGLLCQRRNYRQEVKALTKKHQYVVMYGCGAILNSIVETWNEHIGRRIDYSCDSDCAKWGKIFCGAKCLSPDELTIIKDRCAVFITVGDFKPVYDFLVNRGFPSVNLIYKYDLVASGFLANNPSGEITDRLCQTYDLLSDSRSKEVFQAIVNRVLGGTGEPSIMANVFERHQYFPSDIVTLSGRESFVDIGAFNGDTVADFVKRTGGDFDNIFSFEVDSANFKLLRENVVRMAGSERIEIFNLGVWDTECDVTFSIGKSQSTLGKGEGKGHVVPLDKVLKDKKITFIKMDIEGAEPRALRGARNIITTQKPKLAICVYHDFSHLWEIPLYIKELFPGYRIYLRHHTTLEYETVCYAII